MDWRAISGLMASMSSAVMARSRPQMVWLKSGPSLVSMPVPAARATSLLTDASDAGGRMLSRMKRSS